MLIVLTICYLSEPLNFFSCKELFFVKAIIQHLELILVNLSPLGEKLTLISRKNISCFKNDYILSLLPSLNKDLRQEIGVYIKNDNFGGDSGLFFGITGIPI